MSLIVSTASSGFVTAVLDDSGEPLRHIKLLPLGPIKAKDGRQWLLDDAASVIAATQASLGPTEMSGDYDHQLAFAAVPGVGGRAAASAWVKKFHAKPDGIYADVEWTPGAEAQLRAKEYRYVSPYFSHEKASGRITRLINFALTNNPAITELPAVASAVEDDTNPQGILMKFSEQLAQSLGLPATATEAQILEAVANSKSAASATVANVLTPIATALGLGADAKPDEIATAASAAVAAKADPSKFAPMAVVTALQGQVKALTDGQAASAASTAVEDAIAAGKIAPALTDWATSYATADLAGFKVFVEGAPAVVAPAARKGKLAPTGDSQVLSEEQATAARVLGISEADMLAAAKEEN